jgi:hypothetical protein
MFGSRALAGKDQPTPSKFYDVLRSTIAVDKKQHEYLRVIDNFLRFDSPIQAMTGSFTPEYYFSIPTIRKKI